MSDQLTDNVFGGLTLPDTQSSDGRSDAMGMRHLSEGESLGGGLKADREGVLAATDDAFYSPGQSEYPAEWLRRYDPMSIPTAEEATPQATPAPAPTVVAPTPNAEVAALQVQVQQLAGVLEQQRQATQVEAARAMAARREAEREAALGPEESQARGWLRAALREELPAVLPSLPPGTLAVHPDVQNVRASMNLVPEAHEARKWADATFRDPAERAAVNQLMPALFSRRAASGFTKSMDDVWAEAKQEMRQDLTKRGALLGMSFAPATPAPTPRAANPAAGSVPLSREMLDVFGL